MPNHQGFGQKKITCRFVVEIVDELDISALESAYTGSGCDAYHPRMMLALLFYGYANGVFSSRKIGAATYESVPMRYVAANQHPDHDTICTFRRRFLQPLSDLFTQILLIAHQMGLVEVGDLAFDGSKAKANASKHKAMSWKRTCQLKDPTSVMAMTWRLSTNQVRAFYGKWKSTVEPVFGIIKHVMGFRQFLLRGLEKVNGEWKLL